ncbi:OpgC domain-containing protein [Bosea sp. WAO]|uniref:OpgC family protein n=1 Tax=Bosea sp. WAO TaxID=406341 RepID=UPI0008362922|nr:OpgC domain-containing protein [Bosea sp. WAO]
MAGLAPVQAKRPRDERLDFFRGLTMLIIFVAHLPDNSWNAWIPARFGFSSGAELFVFCSGIASALAFGSAFARAGWWLGSARIAYRMWQVYWAQIGLVLALVGLAAALDRLFGFTMLAQQFQPLLADPATALLGIATLSWQPDYLDILPMYLVILALVPMMMLARRYHAVLPFLIAAALYAASWIGGLNLPGNPWNGAGWFLNPFAWQLAFFLGFFIAMRWLPVPALGDRRIMIATAAFVVLSVPLSFWGLIEHWPSAAARDLLLPADEKTNLHILRVMHFLALAYLVLSLIEPWRQRLDSGLGHLLVLIGRQSLACFLASVVLARLLGAIADAAGRSEPVVALLNLAGFALILATAVLVDWFKSAPWAAPVRKTASEAQHPSVAMSAPTTRVREAS